MKPGSEPDGEVRSALRIAARGKGDRGTTARKLAELIRAARGYRWVGLYEVEREAIAAIGWSGIGQPAHPRFPASQGLCGSAVRTGSTIVVGDVRRDPRYLTTFGSTLSEIVVPVRGPEDGKVAGLIDVESDRANAFSEADRAFLERCAADAAAFWRSRA